MTRALVLGLLTAMWSVAEASPKRLAVPTPIEAFTPSSPASPGFQAASPGFRAAVSRVIYLERCRGGCRITGGQINDARNLTSTIPNPGNYNLGEFENAQGQAGVLADAEWAQIVTCMKEVYSPYAVEVTDIEPASGSYHLAIIAGNPQEVGLEANVLGVAPLAGNCAAFDNVISFSFSSAHPQTSTEAHVQNVCWTAAQESAHAFGLDHEFEFIDGSSACSDPMTYRMDCGGQKFFRNTAARCGEETQRSCRCTAVQNSHRNLMTLFGAGTSLTGAPTVTMTNPTTGGGPLPSNVIATSFAKRGVSKMELFLNGFPMTTVGGAAFGGSGQPESNYGLVPPANMPDSIYDLFVRASDDLGTFTDTPTITVTKNGPCTSADACLLEQKCEAGKCLWDPPVGELGDTCGFDQFCKSLLCRGTAEQLICTQTCAVEDPSSCPQDMSCNNGVCFFTEGGCCSASPGGWMPAGLLAFLVGICLMRRGRVRTSQSR